ncbi:baculoviral IAP repeat-containing protein 5b [Lycodopsis pacificus]
MKCKEEQSFADWPFREEGNCTPEKLATAGFVHCPRENEPDVACCFFCLLEYCASSVKWRKVCHKKMACLQDDHTLESLTSQLDTVIENKLPVSIL